MYYMKQTREDTVADRRKYQLYYYFVYSVTFRQSIFYTPINVTSKANILYNYESSLT